MLQVLRTVSSVVPQPPAVIIIAAGSSWTSWSLTSRSAINASTSANSNPEYWSLFSIRLTSLHPLAQVRGQPVRQRCRRLVRGQPQKRFGGDPVVRPGGVCVSEEPVRRGQHLLDRQPGRRRLRGQPLQDRD